MDKISKLENEILKHKALYYQGRPEISDYEYDKLEEKLRTLDSKNPVLKLVGSSSSSQKIKHSKKMLSLLKTYDEKELIKWIDKKEVISTFKIDGVSCSLIFEKQGIKLAKTRGDGNYGEDITSKIMWVESVPKKLSIDGTVEIRGELFVKEENFFKLALEMEKLKLERPKSPRNIVAGLLGRKDHLEFCRYLSFVAFEIISNDAIFETEWEMYNFLEKERICCPERELIKNREDITNFLDRTKDFLDSGNYQIDGAVFSYNNFSEWKNLGETAHHPRYKIAFKFQGEVKQTILREITWNVSRNGNLTPVGEIEPVFLSGAKIGRVSLHNYGLVREFNLKKGDKIEIVRSGEVIPKFLSVIESSKDDFFVPKLCPSCEQELRIVEIRLMCKNLDCPGKNLEEILDFSRKIGIEDLSNKRIQELVKKGLVRNIADLYKLEEKDFFLLEKVKEKLAAKLYLSIQKTTTVDLKTFMGALGISGGGFNKCEKLIDHGFNTLEKLMNLEIDQLIQVDSFADKSSREFLTSFRGKFPLIQNLLEQGFIIEEPAKVNKKSTIAGKKICITGQLSQKRSEIEKLIKSVGGTIVGSVSKKTDFLLSNETDSNSSKFVKAKELNIPIVDESTFMKKIGS